MDRDISDSNMLVVVHIRRLQYILVDIVVVTQSYLVNNHR